MADSQNAAPKPSSSVKLVLLGEAAVGKVRATSKHSVRLLSCPSWKDRDYAMNKASVIPKGFTPANGW